MIVPMKKVSILIMDKTKQNSLEKLRELGIVHLEKKTVASDSLSKLIDQKNKAETALGVLANYKTDKKAASPAVPSTESVAARVIELVDKRKNCQEQLAFTIKEAARIEKWGDFNPNSLKALAEKGVLLIPYEISHKSYEKLGEKIRFIKLGRDKTSVYGVAVDGEIADEQPFALPELPLSALRGKISSIKDELAHLEKEFEKLAYQKENVKVELADLKERIEFESASAGLENAGAGVESIVWLSGFAPAENIADLKRAAGENGWALLINDPKEEDKPPTLVRNNAFVRLIQPLFNFLGTVPGYREYDISLSYLLFFCLFFAMIFGDAAYGSLLFLITFFVGLSFKKKSGKLPDAVKLFLLLFGCTIVWGALNGAWFAIPYENLPMFLQSLVLPQFNSDVPLAIFPGVLANLFEIPQNQPSNTAYWNVQFLCFTVAIIQLVLAHLKNIKKLLPSLVAIAQLGWLVMMIGLYFLVLSMLLQVKLPEFATYFIGIGLGAYFIFCQQTGGNFFVNIGKSFANFLPTFLNAVGSFADIISYIRLFAVGLAGTSIAQSFNSMSGLGEGLGGSVSSIVLKLLTGVLILAFGHSLNMVMNALSVIVHGVRLNLLEYAGNHLGMEWSGYSYTPFALRRKGKN